LDENLNEKNARIKFLIGCPHLKIEMLSTGNQNDSLKKYTTVACTRTPSNERYGGVGSHANKHTLWWSGTTDAPPTFGVTVACVAMPPLRLEHWHKIGGESAPAKVKSPCYQWPILYYWDGGAEEELVVPLQAGIKDAPNDGRWSYEWCAVMVLQDRIGDAFDDGQWSYELCVVVLQGENNAAVKSGRQC
jgi:hypothetical protein